MNHLDRLDNEILFVVSISPAFRAKALDWMLDLMDRGLV